MRKTGSCAVTFQEYHKSNFNLPQSPLFSFLRAYNRPGNERINLLSATAPGIDPTPLSRNRSLLFLAREKQITVLCLVLILFTLAFYNPVVRNEFINSNDDNVYITDNAHVRAGLTWETVKWSFTNFDAANWHPLTWLSHAFDVQLFGLNPVGPHYVNVLFHAANAILLFLLLLSATGFPWRSFVVAALFALHPINVESVAWASERKNVLSMFFLLLTIVAYDWYVRHESTRRYFLVAVLFALGLMAKPEIITLPFLLLLWDYWPLRRLRNGSGPNPTPASGLRALSNAPVKSSAATIVSTQRSFTFLCIEKLPLLALSVASGVLTWMAQSAGGAFRQASFQVRIGNAIVAYSRYLLEAFWPTHLAGVYPYLGRFLPTWQIFASSIMLLLLTAASLRSSKRPYLAVGWFWFLGTLVPVIGLVQVGVQAMADRYAYLPFVGIFLCVVWGVADLAESRAIPQVWLGCAAGVVLLLLGTLTARQVTYWHDGETFWRHAVNATHSNYVAHDRLALTLASEGKLDESISEFRAAQALHAYSPERMIEIGEFEQSRGRIKEAVQEYAAALNDAADPKIRATALSQMGLALTQMGEIDGAKKSYAYALRENPENMLALLGSGLLAERNGDNAGSVTQISRAVSIQPSDIGYLLLANALRRAGRLPEAEAAAARARAISKDIEKAEESSRQILISSGIKPD